MYVLHCGRDGGNDGVGDDDDYGGDDDYDCDIVRMVMMMMLMRIVQQ